jgi:hypothetical protein
MRTGWFKVWVKEGEELKLKFHVYLETQTIERAAHLAGVKQLEETGEAVPFDFRTMRTTGTYGISGWFQGYGSKLYGHSIPFGPAFLVE